MANDGLGSETGGEILAAPRIDDYAICILNKGKHDANNPPFCVKCGRAMTKQDIGRRVCTGRQKPAGGNK